MRKKKIVSLFLASAIIAQLISGMTGNINAETYDVALKKDLMFNSQTRSEMQEVKENAEELLGEEIVNNTNDNILVYDENGHILNEVHTDGTVIEYNWNNDQITSLVNSNGFKCTYTMQNDGDIIEHSYFNNEKICDKELYSENLLDDSEAHKVSVNQKLKEYNSQVSLMATASNYTVNGYRMNSIMSNTDLLTQSMTQSQIQTFLNNKNSVLKNTISVYVKNSSGTVYDTGRDVKPSTVIYNAAKDHGINPKVLLVILQREQGLVTSTSASASSRAMYFAMGYGATDSGDMTQYTGFDNQVEGAATLLKQLWIEAPASTTLTVNNGKSTTRNGVTYPGSIVVDTFSAYALYKYCPWVFDTSYTSSFTGGQYLFIKVYEGWWSTWS